MSLEPDTWGQRPHGVSTMGAISGPYLKSLYKAKAGLIQPALGGLNLFNHRTHEGPMFIDDRHVL